jgi:hypothetical protein
MPGGVVAAALEILYERRPPAKSSPGPYRAAVLAGLASDFAEVFAKLDVSAFANPQALADYLEPPAAASPPKPEEPRQVLRDERPPCVTCSSSGMIMDGPHARPCTECR